MMTEDQSNWLSDESTVEDEMDFDFDCDLDLGPSMDINSLWRIIEEKPCNMLEEGAIREHVASSIQEEHCTADGARCDHKTKTVPSSINQSVKRGRGRPPKQRSVSAEAPPIATKETPAVALPPAPVPPLRSSLDVPLLIPCDADEGKTDNKIKLNPLFKLKSPPKPRLGDECSSHNNEELKTIISHVKSVKSLLVYQLTSGSTKTVEAMVECANNAFFNLDMLEADYTCFYKDVKDFITYHYDLLTKKRQREMQCFPELKTRYEDAITCANDLKDEIFRTQGRLDMVMKKKEPLERRIANGIETIGRLKQLVSFHEEDEYSLKHEKEKTIAAHENAQQEVQKLRTQVEAAEDVLREIDQCETAVLRAIESTTRRLKSIQS